MAAVVHPSPATLRSLMVDRKLLEENTIAVGEEWKTLPLWPRGPFLSF